MRNYQQVSIVGGSIWGNRGAEAMLVTTIAEIEKKSPDAIFYVYSIYPDYDNRLSNRENVNFLNGRPLAFGLIYFTFALLHKIFSFIGLKFPLPKSLKHLRNSNCLLDMGGITFSDGRTIQLLYNVFSIWPAILLGVPIVKLSQAMGPFRNPFNRLLARYFLPKCKMIFARGKLTFDHLNKLNLPEDFFNQSADIAFLYHPNYSLSKENEEKVSDLAEKIDQIKENGGEFVSIIPSSLVFNQSEERYAEKLMVIIQEICQQDDQHVIVLPNASRAESAKIMNNDLIAIDALRKSSLEELAPNILSKVTWVDFDINTQSIRSLVGRTEALVTSRFHGMVGGLSLCVPTMVIGWSHKYQETLSDFGMAGYAVSYKASKDDTLGLFRDFWKNQAQIKNQLEGHIQDVKQSASVQFDYLHMKVFQDDWGVEFSV